METIRAGVVAWKVNTLVSNDESSYMSTSMLIVGQAAAVYVSLEVAYTTWVKGVNMADKGLFPEYTLYVKYLC